MVLLLAGCMFLLVGVRLSELRPLLGGSGVGLLIMAASFAGAFIAGTTVLVRALTVRRGVRAPTHRVGRRPPVLVLVLGAVVVLDLVGVIAAAVK